MMLQAYGPSPGCWLHDATSPPPQPPLLTPYPSLAPFCAWAKLQAVGG